mmetsp:Transcript_19111/g.62427  ORF Transcript_19111/g.62427 Transcript_19111/m.62427 type:complete len:229 (+) Transcript_19111:1831-2517(+)
MYSQPRARANGTPHHMRTHHEALVHVLIHPHATRPKPASTPEAGATAWLPWMCCKSTQSHLRWRPSAIPRVTAQPPSRPPVRRAGRPVRRGRPAQKACPRSARLPIPRPPACLPVDPASGRDPQPRPSTASTSRTSWPRCPPQTTEAGGGSTAAGPPRSAGRSNGGAPPREGGGPAAICSAWNRLRSSRAWSVPSPRLRARRAAARGACHRHSASWQGASPLPTSAAA